MKISQELLIRFSMHNCTTEEERAVREWLEDDTWPNLPEGENLPDEIRRRIWDILYGRIHRSPLHPKHAAKSRRMVIKVAAVVLVLIGGAGMVYFHYAKQSKFSAYTAEAAGCRILLSDSSVVFLSPHSSITMMQPFPKDKRTIKLEGQAIFEVAHDALRPFTVITGNVNTIALGTSFKVTSYPERSLINVVLSYGKVVVEDHPVHGKKKCIFLNPGEGVVYNKTTRTMEKIHSAAGQLDYKNNVLFFKNAGIKEVAEKLSNYYHVIVYYDSLNNPDWSVSGEFDDQPLDVVMKTIAYSCNISYSIKGHRVILTGQ